jgi:S1-C subfamily serine protease
VGASLIVVGSPFSLEFLVSEGIVALSHRKDHEFHGTYIIHTAMINSGSSGGGLFNPAGELVGVNTMTMGGPFGWNGISMAVDIKTVREFLRPKSEPLLWILQQGTI